MGLWGFARENVEEQYGAGRKILEDLATTEAAIALKGESMSQRRLHELCGHKIMAIGDEQMGGELQCMTCLDAGLPFIVGKF